MAEYRHGGYVIRHYKGDHDPYHVHVYLDGRLIAKYAIEWRDFMYLKNGYEKHAGRIITALQAVGLLS
jgi:hypothetical protein